MREAALNGGKTRPPRPPTTNEQDRGYMMATRPTNKIKIGSRRAQPTVRKVLADSVPYGPSICEHGNYVWCAYEGDEVIAIAPTATEARGKYRDVLRQRGRAGSNVADTL